MKLILLIFCSILLNCTSAHRGRIVGGVDAEIENYPYQISLQYQGKHFCGGSIFKPNVIITAAHCVFGLKASDFKIRAGSNDRENGGVVVAVKEAIPSEIWNPQTIDNDIAILILSENLKYSDKIQPIELATEEPKPGKMADVTGWGLLKEGDVNTPKILQVISIPIWERNHCNTLVGNILTENMMCAGIEGPNKSPCQMDSGGPLVVNKKLVGVVSWGIGCGKENSPSVFSNVPKYLNWIASKIN